MKHVHGADSWLLVTFRLSYHSLSTAFFKRIPITLSDVQITGPRRLGIYQESGKIIGQKLKEQITHVKELCKHMEIDLTGSDLTEKKLPR